MLINKVLILNQAEKYILNIHLCLQKPYQPTKNGKKRGSLIGGILTKKRIKPLSK